jgi:flavin reductase (DIM6/NTAB) family NADH-FMN oxidoreductase RutF
VRESCAPVEIIHDSATRRIVDLTASDEERMAKAAWHLAQAEELMAPLNREAAWRLEARRAACTLWEV